MKNHLIIFAFIFNLSFSQKKETVKLEIINTNLTFYNVGKFDTNLNTSYFYDYNLFGETTNLPKNILYYKITNISKDKYFIVLNDDFILDDSTDNISFKAKYILKSNKNNIPILCAKKNENLGGIFSRLTHDLEFIPDSIAESIIENKEIQNPHVYKDIKKYGFILHPNETKTFRTVVYLPFSSKDRDNFRYWDFFYPNINFADEFSFQLVFKNNANLIYGNIPNEQKEDLIKNGVHIYSGEIKSNIVKVIEKKL